MSVNLIGSDIELMRTRYDEALKMQGIPCKYQFPNLATTNSQGEPVVDSYSDQIDTYVFLDNSPKLKTYKRYGWVVDNDENLPFLIHCSFNLPELQKDSIFSMSGHYTNMPDRVFRVTELSCDLQAPDHMVAQVVPVYEKQITGRTKTEITNTFDRSNHFLKTNFDDNGKYVNNKKGDN